MEGFTPDEQRRRRNLYADRLRVLTDFLRQHPEIPAPARITESAAEFVFLSSDAKALLAATARAFRPCTWAKRTYGTSTAYFEMSGAWNGWQIDLATYRDAVCRRVVTGTEDREVDEEVRPADTRKVVKPVDIVEWVCEPVMAADAEAGEPETAAVA
jgi:hypothetical protein